MIASGSPERAKPPKPCLHQNRRSADHQFPDTRTRKPWVLRIISPPVPIRDEELETPVAPAELPREIPSSQFARIRALARYGMTVTQVAEVYGVAVGEIERILHKA